MYSLSLTFFCLISKNKVKNQIFRSSLNSQLWISILFLPSLPDSEPVWNTISDLVNEHGPPFGYCAASVRPMSRKWIIISQNICFSRK